jgi:hypothetical protein
MIIKDCSECPFAEYDSYYSMSQDSGWNCYNDNATETRIKDDAGGNSADIVGFIPEWCPLEESIGLE